MKVALRYLDVRPAGRDCVADLGFDPEPDATWLELFRRQVPTEDKHIMLDLRRLLREHRVAVKASEGAMDAAVRRLKGMVDNANRSYRDAKAKEEESHKKQQEDMSREEARLEGIAERLRDLLRE